MTVPSIAVLRNVSKLYRVGGERVAALDGVNLDIHSNDYIAIMGPSGSGKSTLLNILGGIDRPSEGEVHVAGRRIDRMTERQLLDVRRTKIGYVFQEARLMLSLSALENVMLPWAFHRRDPADGEAWARTLLTKVGLGKRADHMVHQLSGGEAQRVCIARAMATRPAMILADEPTGNLDHKTRTEIVMLLESLRGEGMCIVLVTHDPEVAARAGRRVVMRDGRLFADERAH